jgi:hypothetical protein
MQMEPNRTFGRLRRGENCGSSVAQLRARRLVLGAAGDTAQHCLGVVLVGAPGVVAVNAVGMGVVLGFGNRGGVPISSLAA